MANFCKQLQRSFAAVTLSLVALPLFAQDAASKPTPATSLPAGPTFDVTGMIGSLLFVILCIVGLTWLLRRSRLVSASGQGGVTLVSQIPLSMKEKLLVVQVGDEKLLLGCTQLGWLKSIFYTSFCIGFMVFLGHFLVLDFPAGVLQHYVAMPWPLK